jgi:hypothetical protein
MCHGLALCTVSLFLGQQPPVGQGALNNVQYTAKFNRLSEQMEVRVTDERMKPLAWAVNVNHMNRHKGGSFSVGATEL